MWCYKMTIVLLIFYFVTSSIVYTIQDFPKAKIEQGALEGIYQKTWKGRTFSAFYGIPYAEPPIGDLRFKPPVAATPWNGTLNASKPFDQFCPQIDFLFNNYTVAGNEDCLYLNVYTPQHVTDKQLMPVIYYIHGGGFLAGSGNPDMYGPNFLLDKDVVLVTSNYRLGALGFLSTGDEVVPGNNGLKDQNMVIKWIRRNIANFGGDPKAITIAGQSAGGVSVHYHVLSPQSQGLFQAAIAHSGTVFCPWAFAPGNETIVNTKRLATFLNCSTSSNIEMVECLRIVNWQDIISQDIKFMEWYYDPVVPFKPTIEPNLEGSFLSQHPIDVIKSGNVAKVPFLITVTTEEGAMRSPGIYNFSHLIDEINSDFNKLVTYFVNCNNTEFDVNMAETIRNFYFQDKAIDNSTKSQLTDFFTDSWFLMPAIKAIRLHKRYTKGPVYSMVFGYRGSISISPYFGDPSHDYGVCHGDDVIYILSSVLFNYAQFTESDATIVDILTSIWENFGKIGNPTSVTSDLIRTKCNYSTNDDGKISYCFVRNENDIAIVDEIYPERVRFWDSLFPLVNNNLVREEL